MKSSSLENTQKNLFNLIPFIPSQDASVQEATVVEDIDEATVIFAYAEAPSQVLTIPSTGMYTEDSEEAFKLLKNIVQSKTFVVEDGCGNGQALTRFINANRDKEVRGVGTDIAYQNAVIGRALAESIGLADVCNFAWGHALHRKSHRIISGIKDVKRQHIILAFRLLPVFSEAKIRRYLWRLSQEMQPNDIWCGSIAIPDLKESTTPDLKESFYKRNTTNTAFIKEFSVRKIETSFGGATFVHKWQLEGTPQKDTLLSLNLSVGQHIGQKFTESNLNNVVLNTYMTIAQFKLLAADYGLEMVNDPKPLKCYDKSVETVVENMRAVVMLKKA